MNKLNLLSFCVLSVSFAVWALADEQHQKDGAGSAVIVLEGVHSREGIGRTTAISVVDRKTIDKLEAFFPNYHAYPSSNDAAPWKAGYRVYFNFSKGRTIRVTVSQNRGGDTWSIGDGDFATHGDFPAFVKDLERRAAR